MSEQLDLPNDATPPAPAEPSDRKHLPGPGILGAVGYLIALLTLQVILVLPAFVVGLDSGLYQLGLITLSGLLAASLIVGSTFGRESRRALALRTPGWAHVGCVLLLVLPLMIVALAMGLLIASLYQAIGVPEGWLEGHGTYGDFANAMGEMPPLTAVALILLFAALFPALYEELYLRGLIGRGLVARWGAARGILLASILFGALHVHPIQSVVTAFMGIVMHASYLWSRSLCTPILLHAACNGLLFSAGVFLPEESLPASLATSEPAMPWPLVLAALSSLAAVCWLYHRVRVRWILPDGSAWTPGYVTAEMPPANLGARAERRRAGKGPLIVTFATFLAFLCVLIWEVLE
jgi:membrane protease YdiL (CAAX protease family)